MKKLYWILIMIIPMLCLVSCDEKSSKENSDSSFFSTDAVHCVQFGAWGGGHPEMYYFAKNGTYYWDIGDYSETEKITATKGTWKIEDGLLILNESQQLYRDSYDITYDSRFGYYLANYKLKVKEVNNTYRMPIKYVDKIDFYGDGQKYFEEYLMGDEKWYCPVGIEFEDLSWVEELINYDSSKSETVYDEEEITLPD